MSLGWLIALAVMLLVVLVGGSVTSRVRKRRRERDHLILRNIVGDPTEDELRYYKALPNYESRLSWLNRYYPKFIEAARRADIPVREAVAYFFDFHLIPNMTPYLHPKVQMRDYLTDYKWKPLSMYQTEMEERKKERDRKAAQLAQMKADAELREAERQEKRAEAEAARKAAAAQLWASLSEEDRESFKNAEGIDERKKSLRCDEFNGFPVTVLYTLVMGQEFPHVRVSHPDSICVAEQVHAAYSSPSADHAGFSHHDGGGYHAHTDTGSHSSFDGGFHVSDGGGGFCH